MSSNRAIIFAEARNYFVYLAVKQANNTINHFEPQSQKRV